MVCTTVPASDTMAFRSVEDSTLLAVAASAVVEENKVCNLARWTSSIATTLGTASR